MMITEWRNKLFSKPYKAITPLEFGMTHSEVIAVLGEPDKVSEENPPLIYKYSDVELHFNSIDDYKLFLVYSDESEKLVIQFEPELYDSLEKLRCELTHDNETYCRLFKEGHKLLSAYKTNGGTQANAFNTVCHIYLDNRRKGGDLEEYREDLIGDWLDCLCGWFGNKDIVIW